MKEVNLKPRLILKFILMFIIPYISATLVFAGVFLSIIVHTNSIWRLILCSLLFGFFMYFIRILMTYPYSNIRKLWTNKQNESKFKQGTLSKIVKIFVDSLFGFIAIIVAHQIVPQKIIVNYFVGLFFLLIFISLLIGNLIPPSLAVVKDSGSND